MLVKTQTIAQNAPAQQPSDEHLLAHIANRDEAAFAKLLERHLDRVRAVAWRVLMSHADTDEIAQEVFLKIWRKPESFKQGTAKFSTWLYRVTLNACIDRQRKAKTVPLEPFEPVLVDQGPTPEQALSTQQQNLNRSKRVAFAIAKLPERQRHAITLSHFENISNIEAAKILNTSVEAVESLLGRARRALKADLAKEIGQLLERGNNER